MTDLDSGSSSEEGLPLALRPRLSALIRHDTSDGTTTLDGTKRKITLRDPEGRIAALLEAMDGRKSLGDLCDTHEFGGAVCELISHLLKAGFIAAAEQLWLPFHAATENPQHFGSVMAHDDVVSHTRRHTWARGPKFTAAAGSLLELANDRRSCRSFIPHHLPLDEVRSMLAIAYSAATRATPSAGGLYSCRIDLLHRATAGSAWCLYRWDPIEATLTEPAAPPMDSGQLQHALDSASLLHGAAAMVIISIDPCIHSAKYGNRGYRYSVLEAGHVAQMLHLAAAERNFGALEWGAFNDGALARLIDSGSFAPVTVVGFGHVGNDEESVKEPNRTSLASTSFSSFGDPLNKEEGSSGVVVAQLPLIALDGMPSGAYATGAHWAASMAAVKARSEFVERQSCGRLQIDEVGSAEALETRYHIFDSGALFPGNLPGFAAEPSQFSPFDGSDSSYQWRVGASEAEGPTIVPVELVYFPVRSADMGRRLCGTATSNGVAAHSTMGAARRAALLELIERDAFVGHWIDQNPPARITPPSGIFETRLAELERLGIEVAFGQLEAIVPVVFCAAISPQGALLAFGLAADRSANAAVEKAFLDAYATYLTARGATTVGTGAHLQHYVMYQRPGSISRIRWFFDGPRQPLRKGVDQRAYEELHAGTCYVDLDTGTDSNLVVVRALSASLRPIWFGSRWQPSDDPNGVPHFFS